MSASETVTSPAAVPVDYDPFAESAITRTAPTTEAQREIWLAASLGAEASLGYNESVSLRFGGELDLPALQASLQGLVDRHDALRSTFTTDGMTLVVGGALTLEVPLTDLVALPGEERQRRLAERQAWHVETPFDLGRGPLVRAEIVRLGEQDHVAIFTAHHIVCDGWSFWVLTKDLAALYAARGNGQAKALAMPESFAEYATAEALRSQASATEVDEAFWLQQFPGEVPVLDLPSDRPRPARKTYASRREDYPLDAALVDQVRRAGARCGASLFATLLAGFKALLFRLSGQDDLVVGIPAAGQSIGDHAALVGHCVNVLPLRSRVDGSMRFEALVKAVRGTMLDAYDHQQYTYGTLLKKLPIARDPSRLPLVSILFNIDQALAAEAKRFEGLAFDFASNPRHFENFELFINAMDTGSGIRLECQYNLDLFDAATIRRWMAAYESLLRAFVKDSAVPVGAAPLLSAEERACLAQWNETSMPYPREACLHELVSAQAARTPDRVAVVGGAREMTYAELDQASNRLARRLRGLGGERGSLVGLCVERTPEMLVGLLGILKAGAAYVPLDPGFPRERLAFMAEDSALRILLTTATLRDELRLPTTQVVCLDADAPTLRAECSEALPRDARSATPDDVAYVIYTSGSTGRPKGVRVPNRAVVNLLVSMKDAPGLAASDRLVAVTTLSFDIAVLELQLPLMVGATVVLATRDEATDGERLRDLLTASRATVMQATPGTWRLLLAAGWSGDPGFKALVGGEAFPRELAEPLLDRTAEVWNMYGPTETTVWSTCFRVQRPLGPILVGRPIGNTQVHILDAHMQPRPLGAPGELWIGGDGVALGYLNRPELTAERFVADPFRPDPGARLYRTGDLGRWRPDGNLECLGRTDFQVKVRGYRIELGEIEAALVSHPAIGQAVVAAREDRPGDVRLVAYVVPRASQAAEPLELRTHLASRLPDYMVPSHFVPLAALPLLPNGKVNRKALPAPSSAAVESGTSYVEPRTEAEKVVAELWQDALSVPRVSVHDNFFRLGGHSLLAAQVLARLRREHGVQLPFRYFFEAPTLEQFAKGIATTAPAPGETLRIPRRATGGPGPLTLAQERALLLDEMEPGQAVVRRLGSAFRLRGTLDLPALSRAIDVIVARHDTLRSVFVWCDGVPQRDVRPAATHETTLVDWSDRPAERREGDLLPFLQRRTREAIDLIRGPVFESSVIRLGPEDHVLFFRTHGLVWDGWSFDIFRRDLAALYGEFTGGPSAALPELPVTYGDFAAWHREWMKSPEMVGQTAFWRERLKGEAPPLELPTDHPREEARAFEAATEKARLTLSEAQALTALAHDVGGTLFTVLLAAFKVLLHRWTGQTELLVGTPVRARNLPEIENLIGPFVNAVTLCSHVDPGESFRSYLERLKGVTLDAFSNQDMPLELLGRQAPVLRAFFSLQDTRSRSLELGSLRLEQIPGVSPGGASDLTLWMMEEKDGLLAALNYRQDLFAPATAHRLLEQYRHLLRVVLADPSRPVGCLPLLVPGDDTAPLAVAQAKGPRSGVSASDLFAEQARVTPAAVALSCGDATVSYEGLLTRVRGLAAGLRSQGLTSGEPVAILAGRPIERVVATLAVLEAGGAVLSVDPSDPTERVKAVLLQAAARRALTDDGVKLDLDLAGLGIEGLSITPSDCLDAGATTAPPEDGSPAFLLQVPEPASPPTLVAVPRLSLRPLLEAGRALLGSGDTLLAVARPGDEGVIAETLLPLATGARLVLDEDDLLEDTARLAQRITGSGATALLLPPDTWSALLAASWPGVPTLKAVCVGGPLEPAVAAELLPRVGELWTAFGVAEAGPWAALGRVESAEDATRLGAPLPGVSFAAVDPALAPVPVGIIGELLVGGEVVARPHGGRGPSDRFVTFGAAEMVHRSGYRVRRRDDGRLDLLPRTDQRRTLRGARVEIGEIESALTLVADVEEAAVLVSTSRTSGSQLVAYVAGRAGRAPTPAALRRHLRRLLPGRLVPASFVILDEAVRLPDGRIDRRALPELQAVRERAERPRVAPRTPLETAIAAVWREMLQVETIGVDDNFFNLGGHSLLATIVAHRVQQETGRRPGLRALMFQTLEQLARSLEGDARVANGPTLAW